MPTLHVARSLSLIWESGRIPSDYPVRTWREERTMKLQRGRETHMAANFSDWAYVAESLDSRLSSYFKAGSLKRSGWCFDVDLQRWMRIKHPLQTLQKSGSLCLTPHQYPPPPSFSLCTHSLLPALTKRRKTRKFNNAFERQDYLRRRLHCYAASEISCALLSVCSHRTPPSFYSSLPSTPQLG